MKKYLLLILLFTACTSEPRFKVGDCVQFNWNIKERWESPPMIDKILEVGKRGYRTSSYMRGYWYTSDLPLYFADNLIKVKCPK